MLFTQSSQYQIIFIFILFISINFCYTQTITPIFRSSNIEIIPNIVVINSTSITDFICINHQPNNLPLEVNLSKLIPSNQIKISTNILNQTAIHIRLESKKYIGIFHLLCHTRGEQSKGTRSDIIVKAAPGVLQLAERCRVYDREYIKCVIQAPSIATAIQNDYPFKFEFNEISHSSDHLAYIPRVEFLKNESTNEYLIFKWKPTIDGEFPNGIRMNMKAILPYFNESFYYFDMTPVFRIKPKFILQVLSSSEIQINLTTISPPAFCEKSIIPKLVSNINQTWTVVETDRNNILINNLLSDTIYRVCIKCRQTYNDPDGIEECQEIKTLSKFNLVFIQKFLILFIGIILILILFIISGIIIFRWLKQRKTVYKPVPNENKPNQNGIHRNRYDLEPQNDRKSNVSLNTDTSTFTPTTIPNDIDDDPLNDESSNGYIPIASMKEVIEMYSPPPILPPPEN